MAPSRNRRPGFSRRAQYGLFLGYVIAIAGAIVAAVLLALATLNPPAFAALRAAIAEITTPVSSGIAGIGRGMTAIPEAISEHFYTVDKNAELRRELKDVQPLLLRARTLSRDNRRLTALLRIRERIAVPVVAARLVSSSASSTRRIATLNAGSWQGVKEGQPVRGPDGLIGRILETGPNTARVLLITDADSRVPVRRTRDGLVALANGRGDGLLQINAGTLSNVSLAPGDVFVTSGNGGIYAPGIPVARVIERGQDSALARSFARADTLDFALVQDIFLPPPPPAPVPSPSPTAKPKPNPATDE
ncbi:rod shape-determining protein MreC [Sphingomonas sp. Leaf357]|uniref:rod shape-determining protein MreC n=1 Tax=Sphingomonas sp. Leaf357 TaxID=1736350 RepID=UPI0007002B9D|nr:rod shape-determining protein MreC [Sphingomonas sp. Leaf357]KQS04938.1 rod shape-determining protein MreC [Sphingomonas sp. Leaf357]